MRLRVELVEDELRKLSGNLAAVGRKFRVTRQAVHDFVRRHPRLKAACKEARETMIDEAESKLYKQVRQGVLKALTFFLQTQGRRRGYVRAKEVEHRGKLGIDLHEEARVGMAGAVTDAEARDLLLRLSERLAAQPPPEGPDHADRNGAPAE